VDFNKLSEEELREQRGILAMGRGKFIVFDGEECISSTGNPQIKFVFDVTDLKGKTRKVWDYIACNMQWKIKEFCISIGHPEWYENGRLAVSPALGMRGDCMIGITKATKDYPEKNKIISYLPPSQGGVLFDADMKRAQAESRRTAPPIAATMHAQANAVPGFDDEIPF